jgi:hypothetical protein
VYKTIAMILQEDWGIGNPCKHGAIDADVSESASVRRGADGIDARA